MLYLTYIELQTTLRAEHRQRTDTEDKIRTLRYLELLTGNEKKFLYTFSLIDYACLICKPSKSKLRDFRQMKRNIEF